MAIVAPVLGFTPKSHTHTLTHSTLNDTIQLSDAHIDFDVKTKRGILSQTSKMFDPLSLCLPVTVRGKVLLRDLWSQKVGWDEEINSDSFAKWSALSKDLSQLTSVEFPRFCIDKESLLSYIYFVTRPNKHTGLQHTMFKMVNPH